MKRGLLAIAIAVMVGVGFAAAQTSQPYAGLQSRSVKALSEQQIADLLAGRGMGLALAAELNGYPGPLHVIELADELGLNEQQRSSIRQMFEAMKAEAVPLGEQLVSQERELDRQFAGRTVTPESLRSATTAIGATHAELRNTHLKYHLSTVAVLTARQVDRYRELRGYAGGERHPQHGHGSHR